MATSQDFVTWSCDRLLEPRYLMNAIIAEGDEIRRFGRGSTHTTIYFPEVKAFHIALPPLPEQRRIVAKIDTISIRSKRAREHLNHIPSLIKTYKQSILTAAFQRPETPSAARATTAWRMVTIADVSRAVFDGPFGSNLTSKDYTATGARVIRLENIGHLHFVESKRAYVSMKKYNKLIRHTLHTHDILLSSFVDEDVRVCLVPSDLEAPAINKADCFCIRVDPELCNPRFLTYRLACQSIYEALKESVHGATRPRINLTQLKALQFEVPTLQEQETIVNRIENAFAWTDRLISEATSASKLINNLDQGILAKALRGELVPQDPRSEPASGLLERIRATRVGVSSKARQTSRTARDKPPRRITTRG